MRPILGDTAKEIFQRWRDMPQAYGSYHLVVGVIPCEGVYSWRNGQIVREFVGHNRHGNLATYREATESEIQDIHEAIEKGWFQIEARTASGCMGVYKSTAELVIVYHQATGRPPGSLPIQSIEQPKRKTRKRKAKPEFVFDGDRLLLTDPETGKALGA